MSNRIMAGLLTVLMILSLTGCGVKEKVNEKVAEKVTEGVMEKATGGEANIDLDKGQLTVKGEDGEKLTFGDSKWPESGAATLIPELKEGKIVSAINSDEACVIMIEQLEDKDFKQYVEKLKDQGFTNDVAEYTSDSGQGYNASLNDNTTIFVLYDPESKAITINFETSK